MRLRGLEPPRGLPHTDLNRARLPDSATAAAEAQDTARTARLERDRAVVLLARSRLWEETGEVGVVDVRDDSAAGVGRHPADAIVGEAPPEQRLGVRHDLAVTRVERDPQLLGPRELGDVPVA